MIGTGSLISIVMPAAASQGSFTSAPDTASHSTVYRNLRTKNASITKSL